MLLSQILTSKLSARNVSFYVLDCYVTLKQSVVIFRNTPLCKLRTISHKKVDVSDIPVYCEPHELCDPNLPCETYKPLQTI